MAGKFIVALCLVFIPLTGHADNRNVIRQSDGSITFVVDEGLKPIEEKYRYLSDGEKMAKAILSKDKTILNGAYNIVASSFEGAKNLRGAEKDAFFRSREGCFLPMRFEGIQEAPIRHTFPGYDMVAHQSRLCQIR